MKLPPYYAERTEHFRLQVLEREAAERKARIAAARTIIAKIEGQLSAAQAELSAAVEADKPDE